MNFFDVTIIGMGRLGGSLALALSRQGYRIKEIVSRNKNLGEKIANLIEPRPTILREKELEKITANLIFITTQDSEISRVDTELARKLENLPFVFHTSGALSSKVLSNLIAEGFEVASFHPLASFSEPVTGASNFSGAYICIEGNSEAVKIAQQIATDLGGNPFTIEPDSKSLYHAAAVTACGHLVALISTAVEMLSRCGLEKNEAQKILLPLIKSTISNLETQMPNEALTGTFARGDYVTLDAHLQILKQTVTTDELATYISLGKKSLELAKQNGIDKNLLEKMKSLLDDYQNLNS